MLHYIFMDPEILFVVLNFPGIDKLDLKSYFLLLRSLYVGRTKICCSLQQHMNLAVLQFMDLFRYGEVKKQNLFIACGFSWNSNQCEHLSCFRLLLSYGMCQLRIQQLIYLSEFTCSICIQKSLVVSLNVVVKAESKLKLNRKAYNYYYLFHKVCGSSLFIFNVKITFRLYPIYLLYFILLFVLGDFILNNG